MAIFKELTVVQIQFNELPDEIEGELLDYYFEPRTDVIESFCFNDYFKQDCPLTTKYILDNWPSTNEKTNFQFVY